MDCCRPYDLWEPMDCSPPDSSVHGILQTRTLEWITIPFFRGSSQPGIEPRPLALQADSLPLSYQGSPRILECVAYPFSRGIYQPRNWTSISCIAGDFYQLSYQGSPTIIKWSLKNAIKYLIKVRIHSFKKSYAIWGHSMSDLDFLNPRRCVWSGGSRTCKWIKKCILTWKIKQDHNEGQKQSVLPQSKTL